MKHLARFAFVAVALAIVLWNQPKQASAAEQPAAAVAAKRPNIVWIYSDDHAYQAIGAYGSKINATPNIDRIAREGMRFDSSFVTNSLCGPARAVILTGKYSHLNGYYDNTFAKFDASQPMFPKLLQTGGYQTALIGKWHLEGGMPQGFDYYHILRGQGPYNNPVMDTSTGVVRHQGYVTDIITELSLDWLKSRDKTRPFMLMVQHKAPHRSWVPSPKYAKKYEEETISEPETLFDDYSGRTSSAAHQLMSIRKDFLKIDLKKDPPPGLKGDDLVRWNYQTYIKDYLRCIDSIDESVGKVLDTLKAEGLDQNTIVMYSADQGFYLGEHGWYDKRWMYEQSLRTPLVVRWPGVTKPGSTCEKMVLNLDMAETFLEIASIKVPDDMQGRSIVPLLAGKTPADWRTSIYYHYYEYPASHRVRPHNGVRNERYKLIHFYSVDEWELFDLQKDPQEMKSVYDDPAYAATVAEMKKELIRLKALYRDEGQVEKEIESIQRKRAKGKG